MALFARAPEKNLIRDRDIAQANVARLAAKITDAELAVIATKSAAQRAALDGDDASLGAAEAAQGAALRHHGNIVAAHGEAGKLLALLESQLATIEDKKLRAATAVAIEAVASDLEDAAKLFEAGASALLEAAKSSSAIISDAVGLEKYASGVVIETPPAVSATADMLRLRANHVLNSLHDAPAAMPTRNVPNVVPVAVQPVTKQVFCMKQVTWTAPEGLRFAPKYATLDLPPDVADRGLALKACTPIPGVEWATFKGWHIPFNHHAEAINLDANAAEGETLAPTAPPYGKAPMPKPLGLGHSKFPANPNFVETVGPVRLMRIVAGGAA